MYSCAEVAELAYAQVSEACAARLEGSNPSFRTMYHSQKILSNFLLRYRANYLIMLPHSLPAKALRM